MKEILSTFANSLESPKLRQITLKVNAVGGINLGQGVCQLPVPELVLDSAKDALYEGINRYTNPRGLDSIREAIAQKLVRHNGFRKVDPASEVLITCGATGAFEGVCSALLNQGDEVVLFEPYYPYHHKEIARYGATMKFVKLHAPDWTFDISDLKKAITPKTKFVLICTPGNPTGKVFTAGELEAIGEVLTEKNVVAVTDETYEYMAYDGRKHISPATVPSLANRTITIGSYSKTFSITGWRIGFLVVPSDISEQVTRILDLTYVCPPAPLQEGVARAVAKLPDSFYDELCAKYLRKRNLFSDALTKAGLKVYVPQGSYYMIADFSSRFPKLSGIEFVDLMIERAKVGGVPSDDFVRNPAEEKWVRFCYAIEDETLEKAAQMVGKI